MPSELSTPARPAAAPAASPDPLLSYALRDGVATLRLNRPAQFNALSEGLLDALRAAIDALARAPDLRCVVLESAGRAFCAGHDLREMRSQP